MKPLFLEDLEEVRRLREPSTGIGGEPLVGIVHREMPRSCTAHRESANRHPLGVDRVLAEGVFESFQRVDLAREFVRVTVAAKRVNHHHARSWFRVRAGHPRCDELHFQPALTSSPTPDVSTHSLGERTGANDPVRLHCPIKLRTKASDHHTCCSPPRCRALGQCLRASQPFLEHILGPLRFLGVIEPVLVESQTHRPGKDLHIGQILLHHWVSESPESRQLLIQLFEVGLEGFAIRRVDHHTRRRDLTHRVDIVIRRAIGQSELPADDAHRDTSHLK